MRARATLHYFLVSVMLLASVVNVYHVTQHMNTSHDIHKQHFSFSSLPIPEHDHSLHADTLTPNSFDAFGCDLCTMANGLLASIGNEGVSLPGLSRHGTITQASSSPKQSAYQSKQPRAPPYFS